DGDDSPPHFDEQADEQAYFRAPIAATAVNYDAVRVTVRPAMRGKGPARASIEPASDYVTLKSEAVTVTRGRSRVRIDAEEVRGQLVLTVRGQIRRDQRPLTFRQRVPEPMAYFAAVLRRRLAAH